MVKFRTRAAERRSTRSEVDWQDLLTERQTVTLTPQDLCAAHLRELRQADSPSLADWQSFHRRFLFDFGSLPLRAHSVDVWVAWLKARAMDPKPLAPKTLSKLLAMASALFVVAIRYGAMDDNPIRELPRDVRPKRRVRDPLATSRSVLTLAELRAVFDVADSGRGDFFEALFFVAALTLGGRFGEIAGLRVEDYRPSVEPLGSVTCASQWHTKSRQHRAPKDGVPKVIPVHPDLARLLRRASAVFHQRARRLPRPDDPLFPFFPRRRNGAYSGEVRTWNQRTILVRWKAFQLEHLPPGPEGPRNVHSLRHTFITRLYAAKADSLAIRSLTHPATLAASHDAHMSYVHVDWGALCDAVLSLDFTKEVRGPTQGSLDLPPGDGGDRGTG